MIETDTGVGTGIEHQYVWSPRYIDAPILRDSDADWDAETGDLGKTDSGLEQRLYYLGDANFNVTCLIDTAGDAVERYAYEPYGTPLFFNAAWSPITYSVQENYLLYTGRPRDIMDSPADWDTTPGLYNVRHRLYHPSLARWMTNDPIGYNAGDVNLYRYVGGRPVVFVDPLGLEDVTLTIGLVNEDENITALAGHFVGAFTDEKIIINPASPDWSAALVELKKDVPAGDCIKTLNLGADSFLRIGL